MVSRFLLSALLALFVRHTFADDDAPALSGIDMTTGDAIELADFHGNVVLVDFWASWCPPCLESLPAYERLYRRFNDSGFEVIAVNVDENIEDAKAFLDRVPVSFPVVTDPEGNIGVPWGVRSLPRAFLIGPDGDIVLEHKRFREGDEEKLVDEITHFLKP